MSFNRNQRRDRHSGGGMGGGGGGGNRYSGGSGGSNNNRNSRDFGRNFNSNQQHSSIGFGHGGLGGTSVSPWAGTSTPESRPSLLPTPGSSNLLSQLTSTITSPEAQLLMASNLLSKLFTPNNQTQGNMSSLLNMPTLGTNYGSSNYTPRDMDRNRNYNNQRTEPYNKSPTARRNQANNKPRNPGLQNRRNRPSSSPAKPLKKPEHDSKDSPDKKRKEDVKKEPEERKTQVKEEKKEDLPKTASAFAGIPRALLYCYVCHKHMWDDSSFENHVKGRPHEWMLSKLDESNKLVVDLLRHQVRTNEEQRRMKFQRSAKKKNRGAGNQKCEFCAMCDVDIRGSLAAHRRNYLHLKLKRFLHPKCLSCKKEFHNRLDFNLHKISADHLKVLAEKRRERRPDLTDDDYDLEDFVVLDDVGGSFTWGGDEACLTGEIKVSTKADAEEDIETSKVKVKEEEDAEMKEETKDEEEGDNAKDKDDGSKIPIYNPAAVVGSELLVNVSGQFCRACYRFMKTDEDAKTHCRTVLHYENYRMFAKLQHAVTSDRKVTTVKTEGDSVKKEIEGGQEDEEMEDEAEDGNEEHEIEMENGTRESEKKIEGDGQEANEESKDDKKDGGNDQKYDPQEPTEDVPEPEPETKLTKERTPRTTQRARRGGGARRGRF